MATEEHPVEEEEVIVAGDAVLCEGVLWRVTNTYAGKETGEPAYVKLINAKGSKTVPIADVQYVAKDSLSGLKKPRVKYPFRPYDWVRHKKLKLVGEVLYNRDGKTRVEVPCGSSPAKTYMWDPKQLERAFRSEADIYRPPTSPRYHQPWDPETGYAFPRRDPEPTKPRLPKDLISTGDLLSEASRELREEDRQEAPRAPEAPQKGNVRKLRTAAPQKLREEEEAPEEGEPVVLVKRRGEW